MTRAEGIFGVCDLRRGSLSVAGLLGRRATEPPMDDGCGGVGPAGFWECRVLLVGVGGSTDGDSHFRLEGVEVEVVLGRGGGAMGGCCARAGFRVDAAAVAPTAVAVVRGVFGLLVVAVAVGAPDPPA